MKRILLLVFVFAFFTACGDEATETILESVEEVEEIAPDEPIEQESPQDYIVIDGEATPKAVQFILNFTQIPYEKAVINGS